MRRNRTVSTLMVAALASFSGGCGRSVEFSATSFLNKVPPELATSGIALNSDGPLQLAALQGQVVWLEFSFLH